jgi:alpha-1,3-rhamnosyl/mannosyltransferase
LPYDGPKVPVIHDLSDIECPEFHIAAKARWFAENIPISVAGACRVHSVSKYSQKRIEEVLKLPVSMIDLVPPGVDDIFKPQSEQRIREICGKYNLTPKRFILSVATLEPRKNLLGLFNAWKSLPDDLRRQYPLVLVGKKGWLNRELEDQLQSFIQTRQVVLTGYVPTEELPVFYSACCLFAYVSFYEGFGMPIAEALACKAQVLASNTTSMPEVGGNKAIYIDPENIVQMNAVLKKMLTANDRGHESFHSSPVFSWDDSVEKLLDSLSKCACEA